MLLLCSDSKSNVNINSSMLGKKNALISLAEKKLVELEILRLSKINQIQKGKKNPGIYHQMMDTWTRQTSRSKKRQKNQRQSLLLS